MNQPTEETPASNPADSVNESLELRVFTAASFKFAISAREVATVVPWRMPTPLPDAPAGILGVVAVQGRMLTVMDPAILFERESNGKVSRDSIVALRGDEQLALAIDDEGRSVAGVKIEPEETATPAILGLLKNQGELIFVLDVKQIFSLAIRGRERRRRHF
jgi:chemotaxis signal transduction protein